MNKNNPRIALVTGGAGFIGSHTVDRLLKEGFEVRVIDNFSTGRRENLTHCQSHPRLKIFERNIQDAEGTRELYEGVDWVIHLAALADIVPSIEKPKDYYEANVQGSFTVIENSKIANVKRFVYSASSSCYGLAKQVPTPENAPIQPQYPYALTKNLGEQLVMHWAQVYQVPAVSLRFFNVYGPRSRTSGTYGAVFGVFLKQKLAGNPYTVVGDGTQSRDFTFVTDIVDAIYSAASSQIVGEVFNVGSGNHYSINKLVQLLGGPVTFIPKRPGEPDITFADITKIKKSLNWTPVVSLEAGVEQMLQNIAYWKDAPLWTPEGICKATETWFKYLK